MSVHKKYKGKRITAKHRHWADARWYVWKRLDGKIIHKAIPLAQTKEEAEHAEREIIREAFDKRYGRGSKETFGDFVERVYRKYVRQNNVNLAVKDLYIRLLGEAFAGRMLVDITPQDCRNAQATFRKRYSASTTNQLMSTASKIFNLAGEEGILDRNPMSFVKRLKEPPSRDRLLSKEEWERLWKELEKDTLLLSLVTLAINLPLRRGQLLAVTPDAIDLPNGLLFAIESKGRMSRPVPLNNSALTTLRKMLDDGLIPFPLKETGLRKRWMKALKRAGIENFRFHDLRHETITQLMKNGIHTEVIRQLYGHSSAKITQIYMNTAMGDMADAIKTLDDTPTQESDLVQ
jgi:integrase